MLRYIFIRFVSTKVLSILLGVKLYIQIHRGISACHRLQYLTKYLIYHVHDIYKYIYIYIYTLREIYICNSNECREKTRGRWIAGKRDERTRRSQLANGRKVIRLQRVESTNVTMFTHIHRDANTQTHTHEYIRKRHTYIHTRILEWLSNKLYLVG